jgi:hypothetical protein
VPQDVSDAIFSLVNDADPTKKALFSLSGITTGTTRTFTLPNTSSELAILAGTQTFTGNKTFSGTLTASGTVTVSAASASIGTATTTATYGMGTGATTTGVTKTVNLGTGGASGSTTVVNIGSATAGAGGTTVVNTPTVTFANAVTQVGMPQANLTAQLLGLGGATADSYNRVSVNTPALLFNNAGAGIEATVNKAAAGNDAAFAFKTGFSARALIGLLGNDDFSFKVSPDGSAFFDAMKIDRTSGQVELPQPTILPGLSAAPTPPPTGKAAVYARNRAGAPWIDVMRPSGRDFPLQPHFGVNRIANWSPSVTTTITTEGLPDHLGRHRLHPDAGCDEPGRQHAALASDFGGGGGFGGRTAFCRLGLLARQCGGTGRLDLRDADFADDAAGNRHGLLRPLRIDRRARHHADAGRRHQLHRHRLPARHPHPLAAGRKRRHRRADADRHGGEFRHRDGWGADPVHRGTAEWQLGLGAGGRRGFGRGVRAGDHRRPACQHAVPVTPAVYEQRGNGGGSRLRLLGGVCGDGLGHKGRRSGIRGKDRQGMSGPRHRHIHDAPLLCVLERLLFRRDQRQEGVVDDL